MIHLFNGCSECASLPGRACTACGKMMDQVDCKPCHDCCEECSASVGNFMSRPLGAYVVFGMLLSGAEIGCALYALCEEGALETCVFSKGLGRSVGLEYWLYGQLGTAWLNLVFAPYIRFRLWQNVQGAVEEAAAGSAIAGGARPKISQAMVKQAFSDVFWHDIGVCIYVFALVASCAWSVMGMDWLSEDPAACDPAGNAFYAANLGIAFFAFAVLYFMGFAMYLECMANTQTLRSLYESDASGRPAGRDYAAAAQAAPPQQQGLMSGLFGGKRPGTAGEDGFAMPQATAPPLPPKPRLTRMQRACRPGQLLKLVACLGLDFFGNATYFVPALGEGVDIAYAPAQAVALKMLFQSNALAMLGFAEEVLPFTDLCPTATIGWVLEVCGVFDPRDDDSDM